MQYTAKKKAPILNECMCMPSGLQVTFTLGLDHQEFGNHGFKHKTK